MTGMEEVFISLCNRLGVKEPEIHWKILSSYYAESTRRYHTIDHIERVWLEFDKHRHELDWETPVEWAIFWHDAFYSTKVSDGANVSMSAHMALVAIAHKSPEFRVRVEDLILATDHIGQSTFQDAEFMCDFDLVILGQSEEDYNAYSKAIRQEYSWVPLDEYRAKRVKILQDILDRGQVFYTSPYRQKYELAARKNLAREIKTLIGEV